MRNVSLPSGKEMPVMGLGTWRMGEHPDRFDREADVIRAAIDLGVRLIDTAEMYGEGGAEEMLAPAIQNRRDDLFLVSKVYPHNASRNGVIDACESSLRRMNCEFIDLYLLHWPGSFAIEQTFEGFHHLIDCGKIGDFGVSNFDVSDLDSIPAEDQHRLGCNQIFYNLNHREAEWQVSEWCQQRKVPLMAYSPLDQASSMLRSEPLLQIAENHDATPAQVALAWLLHQPDTVVIPKSVNPKRIEENLAAADISLTATDLQVLERAFPPPQQPVHLGMR